MASLRIVVALWVGVSIVAPTDPGSAQAFGAGEAAEDYAACMDLAVTDPELAYETALSWQRDDGSEAARHCEAVALIGLERYREAGERLESLAQTMVAASDALAVDALVQAGQAWSLADETARAHAAQSAALELDPDNVELLIDRSFTLALAQNYWEAIDDLNRAHELAPERSDLLIYRASAYRYVEAYDLALEDVKQALTRNPDNLEGLLERGNLRRLTGDDEGARADWLRVVTLAEKSPAAEAARANLERLDVKAE